MRTVHCSTALLLIVLQVVGLVTSVRAQDELQYQRRGDHYEGIKPKPVSGFDIELLSARIDYNDRAQGLADRFRLRFFLQQPTAVSITVRELDYRHYYWLDRIQPMTPWKAGFGNVFEWRTDAVVRRLGDLRISDLAVLARLDKRSPSALEKVAPVVLYQSQYPQRVNGYVFDFRLREDAKVKAAVYAAEGGDALTHRDLGRERGGRTFSFRWDVAAPPVPEGWYKLVLSGYMLTTNDPVSQVVEFYHQPRIE